MISIAVALTTGSCVSAAKMDAGEPDFADDGARMLACLDIEDRLIRINADDYIARHRVVFTREERDAFIEGWGRELSHLGTLDRWRSVCFRSLTPSRYRCGMSGADVDAIRACMTGGRQ